MKILTAWNNSWKRLAGDLNLIDKCALAPYMLTHFQVGVGASSVSATSSVKLLGKPLTKGQYGHKHARSTKLSKYMVFQEEGVPLAEQWVSHYHNQGVVGSAIVSLLLLDEDTANGNLLDEIGLFVYNPYTRSKTIGGKPSPGSRDPSLLGGPKSSGSPGSPSITVADPGVILAAYRHFRPIQKEPYFSLLFRWSIYFTENC